MADNKSSEGKVTTLECMMCGYREVFTERQFKLTDGLRCYVCEGLVQPSITGPGEEINNRRTKAAKQLVEIGKTIASGGIDVANAIKGLKAIQREARKATASLKELEQLANKTPDTLNGLAVSKLVQATNGLKGHTVVFDEMHSLCPKCGSANRSIDEIKSAPKELYDRTITCLDCGYDYD